MKFNFSVDIKPQRIDIQSEALVNATEDGYLIDNGVYQLEMRTQPNPTKQQAGVILQKLQEKFGIRPYMTMVKDNSIILRFLTPESVHEEIRSNNVRSYQFEVVAIPLLISYLPEIFAVIGLILTGVGLFIVLKSIPIYDVILLGAGIVFLIMGFLSGSEVLGKGTKVAQGAAKGATQSYR